MSCFENSKGAFEFSKGAFVNSNDSISFQPLRQSRLFSVLGGCKPWKIPAVVLIGICQQEFQIGHRLNIIDVYVLDHGHGDGGEILAFFIQP